MILQTSPSEFDAAARGRRTPPHEVRDGLWTVALPMPGKFTTLSYLLEGADGNIHIIDAGFDSDENWQSLLGTVAAMGKRVDQITTVILTHLHADHIGMAERLRSASGASVLLHREEQEGMRAGRERIDADRLAAWGVPSDRSAELLEVDGERRKLPTIDADRLVDGGELLEIPGRTARIVWTPGHTRGHICLRVEDAGVLLSGDHVLPKINPAIGVGGPSPTNPLRDYLQSLDVVASFDTDEVAPAHGFRFRGLAERCSELGERISARSAEVAGAMDAVPDATIWTIAASVRWSGGFGALHGTALANALSQTAIFAAFLGKAL